MCRPPHRIKMGVCEGVPGSIMPDHMGRADYHGASVNQAARFMDAGEGEGGAIVTGPAGQAARFMDAGEENEVSVRATVMRSV